ncbi:RAMP superfamily CRISPR-associated protein [Paenibacillus sp. FSL H3-0469]|uniref:RAMP superfamily CRISPR-associated protein n=1 Tax=Paenibacillus sp. FSL H3-0469 TaxID=2954506 RepID=UPI0031010443
MENSRDKLTGQKISVKITTRSNLFIGGSPSTFQIGGVDLFTVTNEKDLPYIPASSLKGTLRQIVREMLNGYSDSSIIAEAYRQYLKRLRTESSEECKKYGIGEDRIKRMQQRYDKVIDEASAEYLFGIEGFNDTPKLLFNDLLPLAEESHKENWFSIDSKNNIETSVSTKDGSSSPLVVANPRTYRTVRPGVAFTGDILFYNFGKLDALNEGSTPNSTIASLSMQFIQAALDQFNSGMYRLGNSGSRGYGRIEVECSGEDSLYG